MDMNSSKYLHWMPTHDKLHGHVSMHVLTNILLISKPHGTVRWPMG